MCNFLTPLFVLAAFVLSLLVSISLPIVKSVTLFKILIDADVEIATVDAEATGDITFGVWGYCLSNFDVKASLANKDIANINGADYCSPAKLGYTFDERFDAVIDQLPNVDIDAETIRNAISTATTVAFVLHVVATILAFLTLLTSLFMLCRRGIGRGAAGCSVVTGVFTALITTAVFLIDVIFVVVVRDKLKGETDGIVTATWGNGPWLMLGATVALWLAVIGACSDLCCGGGRKERY